VKLRPLIFLPLACALLSLAHAAHAQTPPAITEENVLAVISAMDKAARAAKVDDIAAHIADDVRIKMAVEVAGVEQEIELDREKFIFHTRRGFSKRVAYESSRQKTEVTISKDGRRAMVTSELFEKLTQADGTLRAVSSEIYVFNLRDGKILVTSYDARVRLL